MTLPEDVIDALRAADPDVGRAIVALVQRNRASAEPSSDRASVVGTARAGRRQNLIVVDPSVVPSLPGCRLMRIGAGRAFIALEPGAGLAELEMAVLHRLAAPGVNEPHRRALQTLRRAIRRWRNDRRVQARSRSIVVLEANGHGVRS